MQAPVITRLAGGLLACLLAGCAHSTASPPADQPLLPFPLSPASLGHDLSLSQMVTGEYGDQTRTMRVELEVTSTRLVVVALSPLGIPVFSLEQMGDEVDVTKMGSEQSSLDPRQVLSDIQLAHWPAEVVAPALASRGLRLIVDSIDDSRRVSAADGTLLAEISFHPSLAVPREIVIRHFVPPYTLWVTTVGGED